VVIVQTIGVGQSNVFLAILHDDLLGVGFEFTGQLGQVGPGLAQGDDI
jgi:putative protein kinase ArgK-like GTPase of G3E family